jgi:peptide/nickel transport system substrate-binding protein
MVVVDRRRFLRIVAAAGAVGGAGPVLGACNANGQASGGTAPKAGGTLRLLDFSSTESFDPASSQGWPVTQLGWVHRRLTGWEVAPGMAIKLIPDMATDTGRSGDGGRTWTYRLKDGLVFSNGTPVTSASVKWSVERSFAPSLSGGLSYHKSLLVGGSNYRGPFGGHPLASIETPDHRTIVFRLERPYGDWPWITSTPAFAAVPPGKGTSPNYGDHPVATGPYQIASLQQGVQVTLARNPHWARATDPLRTALPDQIVIEMALDISVIGQRLIADSGGDRDAFGLVLSPGQLASAVGNPLVKPRLLASPGDALLYLALNTQKPPLNDPAVRRAFQYAADKHAFQVASAGSPALAGPVATTLICPGIPGREVFDLYPAPPSGDPAKTRQMLAAAGYPDGLHNLTFMLNNGESESDDVIQSLRYSLGRAGIQVSFKSDSSYASQHGGYHMRVGGWSPDYPSANAILEPLFASYSIGAYNFCRYASPVVDAMIARAQTILNPVTAGRAWTAIDRRIMADSPAVPLIDARSCFIRGSQVSDFFIGDFGEYPDYLKIGITR